MMKLTTEQQDSIYIDAVINTFMSNPQLYDKSDKGYVYTPVKITLLKNLSNYLKNEFQITKGVTDIVATWQNLVARFRKADEKQSTGSAVKENDFIYYKDLLFLKPVLKHKNPFSTMQVPTTNESVNENRYSSLTMPITAQPSSSTYTNTSASLANLYDYSAAITPQHHLQNLMHTSAVFGPQLYFPTPSTAAGSSQYPYWPGAAPPYPFVLPNAAATMNVMNNPFVSTPLKAPNVLVPNESSTTLNIMNNPLLSTPPKAPNVLIPNKSSTTLKRIPEYDNFAKKKFKKQKEDEKQLQHMSNNVMTTLEKLNKKIESSKPQVVTPQSNISTVSKSAANESNILTTESDSADYTNLLTTAMSKVPAELQDECMEYILEELIEFNQQFKSA